jgi:hypothetical protein
MFIHNELRDVERMSIMAAHSQLYNNRIIPENVRQSPSLIWQIWGSIKGKGIVDPVLLTKRGGRMAPLIL